MLGAIKRVFLTFLFVVGKIKWPQRKVCCSQNSEMDELTGSFPKPVIIADRPQERQEFRKHKPSTKRLADWEKERRKKDKFVEPKGPKPMRVARKKLMATTVGNLEPLQDIDAGRDLVQGDDGTVYNETEFYGEFNFRDTVLDQLDRYWVYLKRMRKNDPEAYAMYSRLGATVVPPAGMFLQDGVQIDEDKPQYKPYMKLSPWWKKNRPAFGCLTYGIIPRVEQQELEMRLKDDKRLWIPKFIYFLKYKSPPPEIQPMAGGDVYKVTIWWDKPQDAELAEGKEGKRYKRGGVPQDYAVFVDRDGEHIRALKILKSGWQRVRSKKKMPDGTRPSFDIPSRCWVFPDEHKEQARRVGVDPETVMISLFVETANAYEYASYSMIRVKVLKGELAASFGVDIKRVPYFFQDRDITLTEHGVKQRIFHIVRAHDRLTKNGATPVRLHFRGLREFDWAGYRVKITIPGRDHYLLPEYDLGATDQYWMDKDKSYVGVDRVAGLLDAPLTASQANMADIGG